MSLVNTRRRYVLLSRESFLFFFMIVGEKGGGCGITISGSASQWDVLVYSLLLFPVAYVGTQSTDHGDDGNLTKACLRVVAKTGHGILQNSVSWAPGFPHLCSSKGCLRVDNDALRS